jgi:Concanavalin A-like lectin/glucanases superfamily
VTAEVFWYSGTGFSQASMTLMQPDQDNVWSISFASNGTWEQLNGPGTANGTWSVAVDVWNHMALVHNPPEWAIYFNGARIYNNTATIALQGYNYLALGSAGSPTPSFDEARMSRAAIYTGSTYSVPTTAFLP